MTTENQEVQNEIETLRARADLMGITYHPKIGPVKLRAKIDAALNQTEKPAPAEIPATQAATAPKKVEHLTAAQFKAQQKTQRKREAGRLVRVVVTCMDPNKRDWEGEIISVGSAKMGTFKKYVPFNVETGYHIPKIILEAMQDRKVTVFHTIRNARGEKVRKGKLINAFSIEILPPLTPEELSQLRKQQAMAKGQDGEF